uniref:NADH dehydrogenase [ubiquinone] 1 beta subcomplex subunit 9 n=2 Tax=Sinocyclocheilus rhinocerous TaxID=307959 RepID=A0A673FJA1_9TELE
MQTQGGTGFNRGINYSAYILCFISRHLSGFCPLKCFCVPEWCLDHWHPSEKAMYPDYFAKREQWKKLRVQSWDREVQQLQIETPADGPKSEALPPARKDGDLPPLWWQFVTRPRERPM